MIGSVFSKDSMSIMSSNGRVTVAGSHAVDRKFWRRFAEQSMIVAFAALAVIVTVGWVCLLARGLLVVADWLMF